MKRTVYLVVSAFALLSAWAPGAFAGTIEGTVKPIEWAQEVEVCIAEVVPGESCVVPRADGSYSFAGLEGVFKLEFVPTFRSRLLTQFYDHKATFAQATSVSVGPGIVEGIDADLVEGGVITGLVSATLGGGPLPEVEVCAVSTGSPSAKSCGETDSSGAYELHSLPGGSYKVGFWPQGASAEYAPQYYEGKRSFQEATPIAVTAGHTTSDIDTDLEPGAQVRGVVTAAEGGAPLGGIPVCLFPADNPNALTCTETSTEGTYSLLGIPGGSYQVGFSLGPAEIAGTGSGNGADGYLPQYYDAASTRAAAQTLTLNGSQVVEAVDAALATPPIPVPVMSSSQAPSSIVPAPAVIGEPVRRRPKPCKKGYKKKKVKGVKRCVRKKPRRRNGSKSSLR